MTKPTISIAIATLNRRDDLRTSLIELERLDPQPLEVLILLDGCTDGSKEMLDAFPWVKVIEHATPQGSIASRDELFTLATGDIVVSLDDDSTPTQCDFVDRVGAVAEAHPEAGVFAFNELRAEGRDDRPFPPPTHRSYVSGYPNCAGAVRRKIYGSTARYPRFFKHMYEEPDFCLQAYAAGYAVLFEPEIEVMHRYTHVGRNMIGRHHQNARNEFWSVLLRCPFPQILAIAPYRVARQFVYAVSEGWSWVREEPRWWLAAFGGAREALSARQSVDWTTYLAWLRLAREHVDRSEDIMSRFPAVRRRMSQLAAKETTR